MPANIAIVPISEELMNRLIKGEATDQDARELTQQYRGLREAVERLIQLEALVEDADNPMEYAAPLSVALNVDTNYDGVSQDGTSNTRRVVADITSGFNDEAAQIEIEVAVNDGDYDDSRMIRLNNARQFDGDNDIDGLSKAHIGDFRTGFFNVSDDGTSEYVPAATIKIRARIVNLSAIPIRQSEWIESNAFAVVVDNDPPSILGIHAEVLKECNSTVEIEVGVLRDRDIQHFEIRYLYEPHGSSSPPPEITDANWHEAIRLRVISSSPARINETWIGAFTLDFSGQYSIALRIVDRNGNQSDILQIEPLPLNYYSSSGNVFEANFSGRNWRDGGLAGHTATFSGGVIGGRRHYLLPFAGRSVTEADALSNSRDVWNNEEDVGFLFAPTGTDAIVFTTDEFILEEEISGGLRIDVLLSNIYHRVVSDDVVTIERRYRNSQGQLMAWQTIPAISEFDGQRFQLRITIAKQTNLTPPRSYRVTGIKVVVGAKSYRSAPRQVAVTDADTGFVLSAWEVAFLDRPFVTAQVQSVTTGEAKDYRVVGEETSRLRPAPVLTLHIEHRTTGARQTGEIRFVYRGSI